MTTFDKREEGFEKKFAHDEELNSRPPRGVTSCSACGRPGKWASPAREAEAYAKEVVMADFEEAGDHDVFKKIRRDFDGKKLVIGDQDIRRAMDELMAQAIDQIKASG